MDNQPEQGFQKRRKIVKVSEEFLRDLFVPGTVVATKLGSAVIVEGLPADARFRGCFDDPQYGQVCFVFEHPTFEEVQEGNYPPVIHVVLKSL